MYIVELIANLIKNKNKRNYKDNTLQNDYEDCEHIFLPIDSTGETLACSKCGFIVKVSELNVIPKNPFS